MSKHHTVTSDKKKQATNWSEKSETIILGGIIIISLVVALLDFLGALDSIPWLAERVPILILLTTVGIASYLLLERRSQLEAYEESQRHIEQLNQTIQQATSTIIDSLDGVEIQQYKSGPDLLRYVNKRLLRVQMQVDDLSWSSVKSLGDGLQITQQGYEEYRRRSTKTARTNLYREVYIFDRPGRETKLAQRLKDDAPGYSCAYYPKTSIPLLQFMVIDQEEVIILSDGFPSKLAIRHKGLAKLFSDYYDAIWVSATKIKEGTVIHQKVVEQILGSSVDGYLGREE